MADLSAGIVFRLCALPQLRHHHAEIDHSASNFIPSIPSQCSIRPERVHASMDTTPPPRNPIKIPTPESIKIQTFENSPSRRRIEKSTERPSEHVDGAFPSLDLVSNRTQICPAKGGMDTDFWEAPQLGCGVNRELK